MYEKGRREGTVRFALRVDGGARAVQVVGDFNDWEPIAMKKQKDGMFVRHVRVGAETFEYKFLVDGRWINDPDHSTWAANCFGTFNSVGRLGCPQVVLGVPAVGTHPARVQERSQRWSK